MLWRRAQAEKSSKTLTGKRMAWAAALRAPIENHPKVAAFLDDPTRVKTCCANRRGGKTENPGREALARCIERDGYVVWIVASDLSEYSRNWLDRKPVGGVQLLRDVGMRESRSTATNDFRVVRGDQGAIVAVEFPRWGSMVRVWSAKDENQIARIRGGQFDLLIGDEAQKLHLLNEILVDIVSAASADREASIWLLGTPGSQVDGLFAQASMGNVARWANHVFYSWDNPHFGDTWAERYRRAVYQPIYDIIAGSLGMTEEQWALLDDMDEHTARTILAHPVGKTLPASILREYFGAWVIDEGGLVFGSVPKVEPYWADFSDTVDRRHRNLGTLADLMDEPDAWPARVAQLPKHNWAKPKPKRWRAILGVDLGHYPDPFAMVAMVFSRHDQALYELGSAKALRLPENEQRESVEHWVAKLVGLGISVRAVIVDSSGGAGTSVTAAWADRLGERFDVAVHPAEKWQKAKATQIWMLNHDVRKGILKVLRRSPLDIELRALEYKVSPTGKREIAKHKQITLEDGTRAAPGDHCADGWRYAWFWSDHVKGRDTEDDFDPHNPAHREHDMDLADAGIRPKRRKR